MRSGTSTTRHQPLLTGGYLLVLNSVASSALGVAFWVVAARRLPVDAVGIGSTMVTTMTLLAVVAQLGLANALNRFVPSGGTDVRRLIVGSYACALALSLVMGALLVGKSVDWIPEIGAELRSPARAAWFTAALMLWSLFVLQDAVLVGLRRSGVVVVENICFGIAKVALLFVPAVTERTDGLFLAWTLPLVALTVIVNATLFGRWLRGRASQEGSIQRSVRVTPLLRFAAGEYAMTIVGTLLVGLLPVLVLNQHGSEAAAHFSLVWSVSYGLYLLSRAMTTSLVVEGATNPSRLAVDSYRVACRTLTFVVPAAAAVAVGAPALLAPFGEQYVKGGVGLLRMLALSAIPGVALAVYAATERVRGRLGELVIVTVSVNGVTLIASVAVGTRWGIAGIGAVWLSVQVVAAMAAVALRLVPMWLPLFDPRVVASAVRARRRIGALRFGSERTSRARAELLVAGIDGGGAWDVERLFPAGGDVTIALLSGAGGRSAVLKFAVTERGRATIDRAARALVELGDDQRLVGFPVAVPRLLDDGAVGEHRYMIESTVPGHSALRAMQDPATARRTLAAIDEVAADLHARTSVEVIADDSWLSEVLDQPLAMLRSLCPTFAAPGDAIDTVGAYVRASLVGRVVERGRVHGDLTARNVLLDPTDGTVCGLVDWESSEPLGLPAVELLHLRLTGELDVHGGELGDLLVTRFDPSNRRSSSHDQLPDAMVLLAWLTHVSGDLAKSDRYWQSRLWRARNVERVLGAVMDAEFAAVEWA